MTQAPVRKTKSKAIDKSMEQLLSSMLKAILRCQQDTRDLQGICFDTSILEAALEEIEAALEQTKEYNTLTQNNKGHGQGPPRLLAFSGYIGELRVQIEEKANIAKGWKEPAQTLVELCAFLENTTLQENFDLVKFFKLTKRYKHRDETQQ